MLNSIYNWFMNTFVRINPYVKASIFFGLMIVVLWSLKSAFKKSNAKGGDKLKDWKISYFILSGVSILFAFLIIIL